MNRDERVLEASGDLFSYMTMIAARYTAVDVQTAFLVCAMTMALQAEDKDSDFSKILAESTKAAEEIFNGPMAIHREAREVIQRASEGA